MKPASSPRGAEERANLLAQVGVLYYLDGLTQADIADRLRLSRPKVSRLLCAAREAGIVRILVKPPRGVFALLETELEARFGVREVRVVPLASGRSSEWARRQLGAAAAADFARSLRTGHEVGLVGGELLASMIDAVAPMVISDVRVIQGLGWDDAPARQRTLTALVSELARRIEGSAMPLPAPALVASAAVIHGLESDPHIADALRALGTLDTLYVEISTGVSTVINACSAHPSSRPVGHIALRHFDRVGRLLGTCVDGHVVGITVEQMRQAGHVVGLVHGPAAAQAIAAALRTRLIHTLITDELTARAIAGLRRPEVEPAVSTIDPNDARSVR
jgi:deoxyribonucleoside regulator